MVKVERGYYDLLRYISWRRHYERVRAMDMNAEAENHFNMYISIGWVGLVAALRCSVWGVNVLHCGFKKGDDG